MQFLRHMKEFFQLTYKVEAEEEELGAVANEEEEEEGGRGSEGEVSLSRLVVNLSCVGVGYSNYNRAIM